MNNTQQQFIT